MGNEILEGSDDIAADSPGMLTELAAEAPRPPGIGKGKVGAAVVSQKLRGAGKGVGKGARRAVSGGGKMVKKGGKGVRKGVKAGGKGIKKGVKGGAKGVKKGVKGIRKGDKKIGKGLKKSAKGVGKGLKKSKNAAPKILKADGYTPKVNLTPPTTGDIVHATARGMGPGDTGVGGVTGMVLAAHVMSHQHHGHTVGLGEKSEKKKEKKENEEEDEGNIFSSFDPTS